MHPAHETGGLEVYRNLDLGVTGQVIRASSVVLINWHMTNKHATNYRYVKFYNEPLAPTQANTPVLTIPLAPGASSNPEFLSGIGKFPDGLSVRATTGIADNDTGAPTANDVVVNIGIL